jgi:tight adherence protein C
VLLVIIFGVFLIGASAALVGRAIAMPRLRALERVEQIGAYGFRPDEASDAPARPLTGALDGVAKTLGTFFSGRFKGLSETEMRRELMSAGLYRTSPVTIVGYRVISAVCFPATFLWIASTLQLSGGLVVLATPLMLAIGWLAPVTIVRRRARFRLERVDTELPELVDLLVVTVESGMGFAGSLRIAADRFTGPLGDELRLALQEQSMGLTTDQALAHMLERSDTSGMRSFVRSIRQGESLGVSIGQILRNLALEMRKRRRALAEEKAQKAPIKILFPLVGLIFPAIFVVLLVPAFLSFADSFGGG